MNYRLHYNRLIERSQNRILDGYKERHHIVPKCLGGTDKKTNIAVLTAEEHFVAHQLLVKMYPGNRDLVYATQLMTLPIQSVVLTINYSGGCVRGWEKLCLSK